jgi:16S rRNA (guanine966-N2)-methyltransferase
MRIIAGEKKGFSLFAPAGKNTRPTLSRVRESLFSILGGRLLDAHVVDLYAGAGTLGLEALSRGSAECVFVERARPAVEALRRNVAKLAYQQRAVIEQDEVGRWLRRQDKDAPDSFDLVFADPPYGSPLQTLLDQLREYLPLSAEAAVILQCGSREEAPKTLGLRLARSERYGDTSLHFYLCDGSSSPVG